MSQTSLRGANLNLIPLLRAILTTRSVTAASIELGLSQPATSHALSRLRALLGDPLLVQVGRTMHLTPRAEALRPRVDEACAAIARLLEEEAFQPASLHRAFTVATPDYMALLLGPRLMTLFSTVAPGVSVHFTDATEDLRRVLIAGSVDMAIIADIPELTQGLVVRRGFKDHLVGVVAAAHPLAGRKRVSAETMAAYQRLGVNPGRHLHLSRDIGSDPMAGGAGSLSLSASHLLALPLIVAQTTGVAIMPAALATLAAKMAPLALFTPPPPRIDLDICMVWSPALNDDPAQTWFRGVVDEALRSVFETAPDAPIASRPP